MSLGQASTEVDPRDGSNVMRTDLKHARGNAEPPQHASLHFRRSQPPSTQTIESLRPQGRKVSPGDAPELRKYFAQPGAFTLQGKIFSGLSRVRRDRIDDTEE